MPFRQTDLRFSPRLSEKKPALSEVRRALASLRKLTIGIVIINVMVSCAFWQILGYVLQKLDFNYFFIFVICFLLSFNSLTTIFNHFESEINTIFCQSYTTLNLAVLAAFVCYSVSFTFAGRVDKTLGIHVSSLVYLVSSRSLDLHP